MKLVEMKCKNCGASLEVDEEAKSIECPYCHTTFLVDDEVQHVQHDNMYESGYEFEKGRMQAQDEKINEDYTKNKKSITLISMIFVIFFIIVTIFIGFIGYNIMKDVMVGFNKSGSSFDKNYFNSKYEFYSGTKRKYPVGILLDYVVTNNKTNKNQLITVVYGEKSTVDADQIISIKQSLDDNKEYEVVLDYDENGYVNKVSIMDINTNNETTDLFNNINIQEELDNIMNSL